jgi:pimeloyl-ACP methyl ester carboxylesterase
MMSGRHTGEQHSHTVEGTDPQLYVEVHDPDADAGLRPILLIHGFSSSSKLNWEDTGWLAALLAAGRRVITVDLPGHGRSGAPEDMDSYSPSRIRADLLQIAFDAGVRPVRAGDPSSGLDVIGYSLGSRLAWEFGATQPEIVHRIVLGGPNVADPLAEFDLVAAQRYLADGTPIADESTAGLLKMAQALPSNNIFALLSLVEAIKGEPYDPAEAVPHMPMLLVAGENDERAASMPRLAELAATSGSMAEQLVLPGRNHTSAITSRGFKQAAVAFLGS